MAKGFGSSQPSKQQLVMEGVQKMVCKLKQKDAGFRRNMAAAIWANDIDALTRCMKVLALEASVNFLPIAELTIKNKKIEGFTESAFNQELKVELEDMR